MRWGKRHYHRESYFTRQHAKYKRRLRKKLIPGYEQHRKYSVKQWQNRVHERYYRRHTYPSTSERMRMWGEGYNPRPKHRVYRTHRRSSPIDNSIKMTPKDKRRGSSSKEPSTDNNDDPESGAIGCGCSSLLIAFVIGILGGGVSGFFLVTIVLLIADWAVYHSNKKTYDKRYKGNKRKSNNTKTSSTSSSVSSQSSSSASSSSARSTKSNMSKASKQSNDLHLASLATSTTDSLEEVINSVIGASEQGHGFNTSAVHHSILHAEDSMTSIYPKKNDHRREYILSKLHAMYNDATGAGEAFNQPSSEAGVQLHISVHGLSNSNSVSSKLSDSTLNVSSSTASNGNNSNPLRSSVK